MVQTIPIAEDHGLAPISPYGVHKRLAEELILCYVNHFQLRASIVRLFSIYGRGLRKQLLWDACSKLVKGDYTFAGTGNEVRDWLHVEDAASLIFAVIGSTDYGCQIINGGSGAGISVRDLLTHVAQALGLNGADVHFSGSSRTGDPSIYVADIVRSSRLGWQPQKHWQTGVAEYVRWWQEQVPTL
jgi:UDP-glucose 4-epimerase